MFKEKMAVILACRKATAWEMLPGLYATQVMLGHMLYFVYTLYRNSGVYKMCRSTQLDMLSSICRSRLYSTDPRILLPT